MHPTGVHMHILHNVVEKHAQEYHLKWLHWHNFFMVERCQVPSFSSAERTCATIFWTCYK